MEILSSTDIAAMPDRKRAAFVNSLSGAKAANLIGTRDQQGRDNLAVMSSVFHVGASPALLGMIIRPDASPRHTLENILTTGYYTINHIGADFTAQAHQTSARYPDDGSEFDAVGLTPELQQDFPAPFVAESQLKLGMKLASHQIIELNQTHLIIGAIEWVLIPPNARGEDGHICFDGLNPVAITGLDTYHTLADSIRYSYAKVGRAPQILDDC